MQSRLLEFHRPALDNELEPAASMLELVRERSRAELKAAPVPAKMKATIMQQYDGMFKVQSKCPPWQRPGSAPAPPQGAPGGPVQLGTPRVGPGHRDPSHSLRCSSEPPPKDVRPFHRLCVRPGTAA